MLNEGAVANDTKTKVKSEMVIQLRKLGVATPDEWERSVFESLAGGKREEVDWNVEDNQAGYFTWIKAFDQLANELVEDGYVRADERDGVAVLMATSSDADVDFTQA